MVGIPIGANCAPLLADLFLYSYEDEFLDKLINPIWTGLFANLKRLGGGGHFDPPYNSAISSQKTMKLGKGILWIKIFTN